MHRLSISNSMLAIALVAGNLAATRVLLNRDSIDQSVIPILLSGLLPLADAMILGLFLLVRQRWTGTGYRVGILVFTAFNAFALTSLIAVCVATPSTIEDALAIYFEPISKWSIWVGYDFDSPFFVYLIFPLLTAIGLSGPPVVLGLLLGWLANSRDLVIVRRSRPLSTPLGGDSAEIASTF